jgi:hypothetical protein
MCRGLTLAGDQVHYLPVDLGLSHELDELPGFVFML